MEASQSTWRLLNADPTEDRHNHHHSPMEESCGKVINALLEVQEQIRASISPPSRAASPNLDWVSVDMGCGQCERLQNSLEEHLRKLGELAGQIEFATGVLLQMNDVFRPTLDRTIEPRSKSSDSHTPLLQYSSPCFRRPRTISDLPSNFICPDTDMDDNSPRKTVKVVSGGTPSKLEHNQSQRGSSSPTIAIPETSESTLLVIGEPTCLAEGSHDAMETEPTEASSTRTMVDELAKLSSDKDMCPGRREDLDSEYTNDPAMFGEYGEEIYGYLRKLEVTLMPNPHYMDHQLELSWLFREILADWMLNVSSSFKLLPETYWLAMNLLDRFMSRRVVSLVKVQLAGSCCLVIASKLTERHYPSIRQWMAVSDGSWDESDMLNSERYILKTLEYKISSPNPLDFLRRINRVDDYDLSLRTLAKYLILIQCFQNNLLSISPSHLTASAYWLARISVGRFDWTEDLIRSSGYKEEELIPHANLMVSYILEPVKHENFQRLWSTKQNLKVATFLRTWASNNWTRPQSGSEPAILPVDLSNDLPRLKKQPANEPCNSP